MAGAANNLCVSLPEQQVRVGICHVLLGSVEMTAPRVAIDDDESIFFLMTSAALCVHA